MSWSTCYNHILPHVFRVGSQGVHGSGVFIGFNEDGSLAAVATAGHVIRDADEGDLPITLRQHLSGKEITLEFTERVIYADRDRDSAVLLFPAEYLDLPDQALPLLPEGAIQPVGTEVAWVGYPVIGDGTLCFFSGRISAPLQSNGSYVIDGVTMSGVSGGPVFELLPDDTPRLLGIMRAYFVNTGGPVSSGLSLAADVSHFHETIMTIRSIDQSGHDSKENGALHTTSGATGALEGAMRPATAAAERPVYHTPAPEAATRCGVWP